MWDAALLVAADYDAPTCAANTHDGACVWEPAEMLQHPSRSLPMMPLFGPEGCAAWQGTAGQEAPRRLGALLWTVLVVCWLGGAD